VAAQIGSDNNWVQVCSGKYHTLGRKSDGSLWAWGWNEYGQLGDGSTADSHTPVQVGTDSDWKHVSAGNVHTTAIKSDGTLWAWGWNEYGQLGDGSTADRHTPVQVGTDKDWIYVSASSEYTMALKSNGTLWAWGRGDLGNGSPSSISPLQVGTEHNWISVSAGLDHALALRSDGTFWAWGLNNWGQIGDGTFTYGNIIGSVGRYCRGGAAPPPKVIGANNTKLYIGDVSGSQADWSFNGRLAGVIEQVDDFSPKLNSLLATSKYSTYTDNFNNEFVYIPLNFTSTDDGLVRISSFFIEYTYTATIDRKDRSNLAEEMFTALEIVIT